LLTLLLIGLVIGGIARLLVSGTSGLGLGPTILVGIAGSFLGGFAADWLFERGVGNDHPQGDHLRRGDRDRCPSHRRDASETAPAPVLVAE